MRTRVRTRDRGSLFFLNVCFIGLLCVSTLGCASKEEKKAKHLERAKEYINKSEYNKAVIELKNALQIDPKDEGAYYDLGEMYLKLGQGGEAFQAFSRAASVNPVNLKAQLKLGQILLLTRKTEEAKKKVELVLEKSPDDIEALSLLSGVQVQEKDLDAALKTLERAASLNPKHFQTELSLGRLLILKGDFEKAKHAYLKAISINPSSNIPYIELSGLYSRNGEWERAEAELKNMIQASGSSYQNLQVLAGFYESARKWDLAEKTYLEAVEAAPKTEIGPLMNLAAYYARQKNYEKALDPMNRALAIKKDDSKVLLSLAQLHFDFNKRNDAESAVDRILEKDKGHVGANLLKGRLDLLRKDYGKAIERFDLVVKEIPDNAMGYYFRALSLVGKGDPNLAQQDLLKVVELNPRFLDARLLLGDFYLRERKLDLARQHIDAARKLAPQDVRVLMVQGNLKILEGDAKGAEQAYLEAVKISPDFVPGHIRLGLLYNLTKRQDAAVKSFTRALELNPQQADAMAMIVGVYLGEKKYEEAFKFCEEQKRKAENRTRILALIESLEGNIYIAKGDSRRAEQSFKKAIEMDPSMLAPYVALASIYVKEQRLEEAISEYETILSKNPDYLAGYMALGVIYDRKGKPEKAETYYRKALAKKKDFGPAANNLAWSLAERGGNIDQALTFAQIAKEQMPNSAAVMDTLGWIYYVKGSYLYAIAEFEDSLSRDPNNAVINYHMGLACYKNNQADRAREFLEKALKLDEKFKGAQEARKILEEIKG